MFQVFPNLNFSTQEGASAPVVIDPPPGGEGGECKFECKRVEYIARFEMPPEFVLFDGNV